MIRVVLGGDDLDGFDSPSADDHIKLFIPDGSGELSKRDYTPRAHDADGGLLTIDFAALHAGPATDWAVAAKIGDSIEIGGPRGSKIVSDTFDWWLLIGDETSLPSIGRRIEAMTPGRTVVSIIAVTGEEEQQTFATRTDHRAHWVHRPSAKAGNPEPHLDRLRAVGLPEGEGFVWIAAEASVARALRHEIIDVSGHPAEFVRSAGYWQRADNATNPGSSPVADRTGLPS